jgi:hypothetical protein
MLLHLLLLFVVAVHFCLASTEGARKEILYHHHIPAGVETLGLGADGKTLINSM